MSGRRSSVLFGAGPALGRFGFVLCAHVVDGGLKLVRVANAVQKNQPGIRPWEAGEIPLGFGRRRKARKLNSSRPVENFRSRASAKKRPMPVIVRRPGERHIEAKLQ